MLKDIEENDNNNNNNNDNNDTDPLTNQLPNLYNKDKKKNQFIFYKNQIYSISFLILFILFSIIIHKLFSSHTNDSNEINNKIILNYNHKNKNSTFIQFIPSNDILKNDHLFHIPLSFINEPFIIHATYDKGIALDGKIEVERAYPAENNDRIVYRFRLTEDNKNISFIRDDYLTRTSSTNINVVHTFSENKFTGHLISFNILNYDKIQLKKDDYYEIVATPLLSQGFFLLDNKIIDNIDNMNILLNNSYTYNYNNNTNILIEYQHNGKITYYIFFSLYQLPYEEMESRQADPRVGYFSIRYLNLQYDTIYNTSNNNNKNNNNIFLNEIDTIKTIINRRRIIKDNKSNIVKNPIIYVIDTSVPIQYRKYFKEGIEIWNKAFEKIDILNAIKVILPTDIDYPNHFHIGDLRYNSVSVMLSSDTYAFGPTIIDPRTGEVLNSDIIFSSSWISSWMELLQINEYSTTNLNDVKNHFKPNYIRIGQKHRRCNKMNSYNNIRNNLIKDMIIRSVYNNDNNNNIQILHDIIGGAVRDVMMHEVGHSLGLRHNFMGSMARTISELHDYKYIQLYGLSSSVMDYLPINIWSTMNFTPNTIHSFPSNYLFTSTLGEYDYAAIKYGYMEFNKNISSNTNVNISYLLDKIASKTPLYATDEDEDIGQNPYAMKYDLSNDPLQYYFDQLNIIKNIRKNIYHIVNNNIFNKYDFYTEFWNIEKNNLYLINDTIHSLSRFIGGINITTTNIYALSKKNQFNHNNNYNNIYTYINKTDQLRIIHFLNDIILQNISYPSMYDEENDTYYDEDGIERHRYFFIPSKEDIFYVKHDGDTCGLNYNFYCNGIKKIDLYTIIVNIKKYAIDVLLNREKLNNILVSQMDGPIHIHEIFELLLKPMVFSKCNSSIKLPCVNQNLNANCNIDLNIYMHYNETLTNLTQVKDARINTLARQYLFYLEPKMLHCSNKYFYNHLSHKSLDFIYNLK